MHLNDGFNVDAEILSEGAHLIYVLGTHLIRSRFPRDSIGRSESVFVHHKS